MLRGITKAVVMAAVLLCGIPVPSTVYAQAPVVAANVWTPPAIAFNDCMRLAAQALREAGSKDVAQKTIFAGMGFNQGRLGDYSALIMCITFKSVVTFYVAGLDGQTAETYRMQLNKSMGNP